MIAWALSNRRTGSQQGDTEVTVKDSGVRTVIRNFAIEIVIYAVLVVGYFFLVLRLIGEPLVKLFNSNLTLYAIVALVLIVAQGVLLEAITSFLIDRLGLENPE
jgi:hypothetical protein